MRFTEAHEWVRAVSEDTVRLGITDFAQQQLGDVVMLQLPEVGQRTTAGEELGEIDSTKTMSEVYAPVSGEVVAVNEALTDSPELVNSEPYGAGWMVEIRLDGPVGDTLAGLLDAQGYRSLTEQS
ncbi:MAG: glycine cleavage system protein GcvH [Pseudonocardiales bacterium]|nr:glycine cleavage system protein GcvH [Pseudonocardiales bacterium]